MITSLSVRNFKSWATIEKMRFAPITGLFGANSSGKSSILQLLLLMKQTGDLGDPRELLFLGDQHSPAMLGTFRDLVHRGYVEDGLCFSVSWRISDWLNDFSELEPWSLETQIDSAADGRPRLRACCYRYLGDTVGVNRLDLESDIYEYSHGSVTHRLNSLPPGAYYRFPRRIPAELDANMAAFGQTLVDGFELLTDSIEYLGPLREYPYRSYTASGTSPGSVGFRGERSVDLLLGSPEIGDQSSASLQAAVATQLRQLGLVHDFVLREVSPGSQLWRAWVKVTRDSREVLLTDVGFGVSQVLPVIVACLTAPRASIVILEQPELHLHPAVQSALADVLIGAVRRRNIQIIVESHSEHLLHRLQRRIAEEYCAEPGDAPFTKDEAALYFCRMEGGESKLDELKLDELGNISNYPEHFFGDPFGEISAQMDAQMRRKGITLE